jgi:segregation and condensation protein A
MSIELTEKYKVRLEHFEGPLDLLLKLIEQEKLDITVISLAQIAGQYLEYVRRLQEVSPQSVAEFLAIASRLLYLKSRFLLEERQDDEAEDEEDDGESLARQLRVYKAFKEKARYLAELAGRKRVMFIRIAQTTQRATKLDTTGLDVWTLKRMMEALEREEGSEVEVVRMVTPPPVTIHRQIESLRKLLKRVSRLPFSRFVRKARSKVVVIVSFLAVLEMIRRREVVAEQPEPFGEIVILKKQEG